MDEARAGELAGRRLAKAAALALALVAAVNLVAGLRLTPLLQDTAIHNPRLLLERIAAHPAPERVRVLLVGNSHVQAGLRPEQVARALGAPPEAVFSVAFPAASTLDAALVTERARRRFPGLRAAVIALDPLLLVQQFPIHARWLTRTAPWDRWRLARHEAAPGDRAAVLLLAGLPAVDFHDPLIGEARQAPARFAERLWREAPDPDGPLARMRRLPPPYGLPPPWHIPDPVETARKLASFRETHYVRYRATRFLPGNGAQRLAASLVDLDDLLAGLRAAGVAPILVRAPLHGRLTAAMRAVFPQRQRDHEAGLARYLATRGLTLREPPTGFAPADWDDVDHLGDTGAARWAHALATGPDGPALVRAAGG